MVWDREVDFSFNRVLYHQFEVYFLAEVGAVIIVGDPIAQVKSPAGVSETLQAAGKNALVVPIHISPTHLAAYMAGASATQNIDGMIVTVPHKFACTAFCDELSERAAFLGTVNTVRRDALVARLLDALAELAAATTN